MPRWKVTIEYHGGLFVGWQRQDNGISVQQSIADALYKFTGETIKVTSAGRTDAGVHALGQVAHFDLEKDTTAEIVRDAVNAHLRPLPISILSAEPTEDTFHARLLAVRRHYCYRILNRRSPEALAQGLVWHIPKPLDADLMHEAAQIFVGRHDFSSFRAVACQAKSPIKTLDAIEIVREEDEIILRTSARSFLHHQVRNMVGTLKLVGAKRWSLADVQTALEAKDRSAGGPTAPAQGLYFVRVDY